MWAEGPRAGSELSHLMEGRKWAEEKAREITRLGSMAQS